MKKHKISKYLKDPEAISNFLSDHSTDAVNLSREATEQFNVAWLKTFASLIKKEHGAYIYLNYRWHGYSFRVQPCTSGKEAIESYKRQANSPFYVFNESLSYCALCKAEEYPDLSSLQRDIYVAHHKLKWTMAFTHEQPQIGPFFAEQTRPIS